MCVDADVIENSVFSPANPATPTKSFITFINRFHFIMKTVFFVLHS